MIYTKLENKLIGIRKMLPKVNKTTDQYQLLVKLRYLNKEKLKSSKLYFFNDKNKA